MTYAILKSTTTIRATRNRCYFIRHRTPSYLFLEKPTQDEVEIMKVHISQVFCESEQDVTSEITQMNDRVAAAFAAAERMKTATLSAIKAIAENP